MFEYLVRDHIDGSHYITTADPKLITEICRTCGDYDMIEAVWEQGNFKQQHDAILPYCYEVAYIENYGIDEEDCLISWLTYSGYDDPVDDDLEDSFDEAKKFVDYLEYKEGVDHEVAEQLRESIMQRRDNWLEMLNSNSAKVLKKII